MKGSLIGPEAEKQLRIVIAKVLKEMKAPRTPPVIQPPRITLPCVVMDIQKLDDEDHPLGLYKLMSCNPNEWVEVLEGTIGHCPYSEGDSNADCDFDAYDPGETWTPVFVDGFTHSWSDPDSTTPPPDMDECPWVDFSYTIGSGDEVFTNYIWKNCCGAVAYGDQGVALPG